MSVLGGTTFGGPLVVHIYMYRSIEDIRRNAPKLEFWRSYGIECADLAVSAVAHRSNSVLLACGRSGVRIPVATDLSRLNT